MPPGELLPLDHGLALARAWYSDRLDPAWRRRTPAEAEAIFAGVGLRSEFWRL